jgi:hypothetical protein
MTTAALRPILLLAVAGTGLIVWAVHFLILYIVAALDCEGRFDGTEFLGIGVVGWVTIVATLGAIGVVAFVGLRAWRRMGQPPRPEDRHREWSPSARPFLHWLTIAMAVAGTIAILMTAYPVTVFVTCR